MAHAKKEVVRFGVSLTYDVPVLITDKKTNAMSGIAIDIVEHVSQRMAVDHEVIQLPRNRMEKSLMDGEIDVICYSNPAWTKNPELSNWSNPILETQDYIVRHIQAKPIASFEDLKDQTVGAVAGYFYEKIDPFFKNNTIQRSDFFDPEGMYKRLQLGQIHYGILNKYYLEYLGVKLKPETTAIHSKRSIANQPIPIVVSTGLVDSSNKIYCRTSKTGKIDMKRINKALEGFHLKTYIKETEFSSDVLQSRISTQIQSF